MTAKPHPLPRLVIHAGLGKSGSSAIQRYCRTQGRALRQADAFYLGMHLERGDPSTHDFASSGALEAALVHKSDTAEDRLVALLTDKITAKRRVRTFVWSQIALAMRGPLIGRVAARLADVCEVEAVLYFRHQADWLVSAYRQWGVKHKTYAGPLLSFDAFRPQMANKGGDYRRVIEGWRAALPAARLHLRSYDRAGDVVADFLSVARLGAPAADAGSTRHYETPDDALLTLFRLHQGQQEGTATPGALHRAILDNGLEGRRYRAVDPASTLPTGEDWARFAASFDAENAGLKRDFGLDLGPPGPGPAPDETAAAPAIVISALIDLILGLDRRVATLEKALKERDGDAIEPAG